MSDLREQLQQTLGDAYTLERELGGGSMARVFVAEETALGRRVVVKVLAPELAEGLSASRFEREVRLAARLQHPHILLQLGIPPVLCSLHKTDPDLAVDGFGCCGLGLYDAVEQDCLLV